MNFEEKVKFDLLLKSYQFGTFESKNKYEYVAQLNFILAASKESNYYSIFKEWFGQKVCGEYVSLPVNCKRQFIINKTPSLKRLLDEKYVVIKRAYDGGNKKQSYLQKMELQK